MTADELVEVLAMRHNKRQKYASHGYGDLHWTPKGFAVEQREDENVERLPWALSGEPRADVGCGHVGHGEGDGGEGGGAEGRGYVVRRGDVRGCPGGASRATRETDFE